MFYFGTDTEVNAKSAFPQSTSNQLNEMIYSAGTCAAVETVSDRLFLFLKNTRVAERTCLDMDRRMNSRIILSVLIFGIAPFAKAGTPPSPVAPAATELRPFQADRPDQTEGPFTVVPGHLQVELDLINLSVNRSAGQRSTTWNTVPVLFKYDLFDNLDFEAGFGGWTWDRTEDRATGNTQHSHGSGDTLLRLK